MKVPYNPNNDFLNGLYDIPMEELEFYLQDQAEDYLYRYPDTDADKWLTATIGILEQQNAATPRTVYREALKWCRRHIEEKVPIKANASITLIALKCYYEGIVVPASNNGELAIELGLEYKQGKSLYERFLLANKEEFRYDRDSIGKLREAKKRLLKVRPMLSQSALVEIDSDLRYIEKHI